MDLVEGRGRRRAESHSYIQANWATFGWKALDVHRILVEYDNELF
jgi:hypothetical protein